MPHLKGKRQKFPNILENLCLFPFKPGIGGGVPKVFNLEKKRGNRQISRNTFSKRPRTLSNFPGSFVSFQLFLEPLMPVFKTIPKVKSSSFVFQHLVQVGYFKIAKSKKKPRQSTYLDEYMLFKKNLIKKLQVVSEISHPKKKVFFLGIALV